MRQEINGFSIFKKLISTPIKFTTPVISYENKKIITQQNDLKKILSLTRNNPN